LQILGSFDCDPTIAARIDGEPLESRPDPEGIPTAFRDRSRSYPEASEFNPEENLGIFGICRDHGV
jgi:hypothetical protein